MERRLKERLIGAAVLVMLAVIFIPMILDDSIRDESEITGTNIPERPEGGPGAGAVSVPEPDMREIPPLLTDEVEAEPIEVSDEKTGEAALPDGRAAVLVDSGHNAAGGLHDKINQKTPATPDKSVAPKTDPPLAHADTGKKGLTAWVVQLGSFGSRENADNLSEKLRQAGYAAFVEPVNTGSETAYRVRVGPELLRSDALALQKKINEQFQQKGIVLRYP